MTAMTRREAELRTRIGELARELGTVIQIQRTPSAQSGQAEIRGPAGAFVQKVHVATTGGEELAGTIGRAFGLEIPRQKWNILIQVFIFYLLQYGHIM